VKRPETRLAAGKEYHRKTTGPHQMGATDASYFRVVGWGYFYLVTVMADYSWFIPSASSGLASVTSFSGIWRPTPSSTWSRRRWTGPSWTKFQCPTVPATERQLARAMSQEPSVTT